MPRYVILEHDYPFLHWDFMLEAGEVLRTWRLLREPQAGKDIPAEALGDHRKAYLDYEGPVRGNRGTVKRWDSGMFTDETRDERVVIVLEGGKLRGRAVVECDAAGAWMFRLD